MAVYGQKESKRRGTGTLGKNQRTAAELEDELGYSRYDYKSKNMDNSRNGYSSKNLRTIFGDVELSVPCDRKGEFEPQVFKKNQTSISQ